MSADVDSLPASFFDRAATPFAVLERGGKVLRMNAAWKAILATPSAAMGGPISDVFEPGDAQHLRFSLDGLTETTPKTLVAKLAAGATGKLARAMRLQLTLDPASGHVLLVAGDAFDNAEAPQFIEREQITLQMFSHVVNSASAVLWSMDSEGVCTMAEGKGLERLGLSNESVVGRNIFDVYKDNPELLGSVVRALGGEEVRYLSTAGEAHFDVWLLPLRQLEGSIDGVIGLAISAAERVKNEQELRGKLELIERQSATIRALATPIIQIWDEVLCLPVIGTVDSARTADMMQGLLESIVREQARYAIVDLTGVEVVDTSTADHLIRLFRAAKVLGVDGILCGIRPAVAQTIVALGLDLASVRTMRSLRDALVWCIRTKAVARAKGLESGTPAPKALPAGERRAR